jgi:hypothetical protein
VSLVDLLTPAELAWLHGLYDDKPAAALAAADHPAPVVSLPARLYLIATADAAAVGADPVGVSRPVTTTPSVVDGAAPNAAPGVAGLAYRATAPQVVTVSVTIMLLISIIAAMGRWA